MAENDTLLVEHRTTTNAPPLEDPLTLDALLLPLSKDDFLRQHFRQRCVVIRGGGAERAATLFPAASAGDVEEVVENTASERVMAWVRTGGTVRTMDGLPPSRGTTARSVDVDDPRSAVALHEAGHALYCRAPPGIDSMVDIYRRLAPALPGRIVVFNGAPPPSSASPPPRPPPPAGPQPPPTAGNARGRP